MVEPYFVTDIAAAANSEAVTCNSYYFVQLLKESRFATNIVVMANSESFG